ncbi:hypothetical protein EDB83DRAFT_2322209 [Lactarius deliciosus]|nr:hypothetical protein EDB83DRAFT_2322209 [Lactarius deliciosus]
MTIPVDSTFTPLRVVPSCLPSLSDPDPAHVDFAFPVSIPAISVSDLSKALSTHVHELRITRNAFTYWFQLKKYTPHLLSFVFDPRGLVLALDLMHEDSFGRNPRTRGELLPPMRAQSLQPSPLAYAPPPFVRTGSARTGGALQPGAVPRVGARGRCAEAAPPCRPCAQSGKCTEGKDDKRGATRNGAHGPFLSPHPSRLRQKKLPRVLDTRISSGQPTLTIRKHTVSLLIHLAGLERGYLCRAGFANTFTLTEPWDGSNHPSWLATMMCEKDEKPLNVV